MILNDFYALRAIKDGFMTKSGGGESTGMPNQKDCLQLGQKVRMIDSDETAVIKEFGAGFYVLDKGGLTIQAGRKDFYPINLEEDARPTSSVPSKPAKDLKSSLRSASPREELQVDLHLDQIPGHEGVPEYDAKKFQLEYFRSVLSQNLKHRGRRITFIPGRGMGVLAYEIKKDLDRRFAHVCRYTVETPGTIKVTIR